MLTRDRLIQILSYDPLTGDFRRLRNSSHLSGRWRQTPGALNTKGYRQIRIDGVLRVAHHLAWLYVYGVLPLDQIDHINGNKDDNRIANLRAATNKQNGENRPLNKNNPSGYRGVWWSKRHGKWRAGVGHNNKHVYVGLFNNVDDAGIAVKKVRDELFTHNKTEYSA